jgi:large subunit ribosomal protein L31
MKSDIHPDYRPVVIQDVSGDFKVLTRSTAATDQTIEWEDGNTYPLIRVEISSASHPFYTGKRQLIAERGGRIEQFRRRYGDKAAGN